MDLDTKNSLAAMYETINALGVGFNKLDVCGNQIEDAFNTLSNSGATNEQLSRANDVTRSVASTIDNNVESLTSGNDSDTSNSVFDIISSLSSLSDLISLAGPEGEMFVAIVSSVCGLVNGVLSLFGCRSTESPEETLERVITHALAVQTNDDLESDAQGEMKLMKQHIASLIGYSKYIDLDSDILSSLAEPSWTEDGSLFLGKLAWFISNKYSETTDDTYANYCANYIYCYCHILTLKLLELSLLSTILDSHNKYQSANNARIIIKSEMKDLNDLMKQFYCGSPNGKNNYVYSALHLNLNGNKRGVYQTVCRECGLGEMAGKLCFIWNVKHTEYLYVMNKGFVFAWADGTKGWDFIFRIFEENDYYKIYNVGYKTYINPNDSWYDGTRGHVARDFEVNNGTKPQHKWYLDSSLYNDGGEGRIKSLYKNAYLYASTISYVVSGSYVRKRAMIWLPGDTDSDQIFKLQDIDFSKDYDYDEAIKSDKSIDKNATITIIKSKL